MENTQIIQTKAKPIFKEEKEWIEKHLPEISPLPDDCWIVGGGIKSVYLDLYCKQYFVKFRVENNGNWILLKDNRDKFKDYQQTTIAETLDREKERLENDWNKAIERTALFVSEFSNIFYSISISGGKDSEVLYHLWYDVLNRLKEQNVTPEYQFIFFNTTNECADVYKYIKARPEIKIINPDISWWQWIETVQKYALPTVFKRSCCSKYKEGQVKKIYDNNIPIVQVIGIRNQESIKRAECEFYMDYQWDVDHRGKSNQSKKWIKLCPLIDYSTTDIWLIILLKDFYVNPKYKYGWGRCGCNICPFGNSYEDYLIREYYPKTWERFCKIAEKGYNYYNILQIEGFSLQSYINGVWKRPENKEMIYIRRQPTSKNIHALAEYKGISDEMAAKYWERTCSRCGKNITPIANSMFFKLFGRLEGQDDNRGRLCQKCICEEFGWTAEEYFEKAMEFKNEGCDLF